MKGFLRYLEIVIMESLLYRSNLECTIGQGKIISSIQSIFDNYKKLCIVFISFKQKVASLNLFDVSLYAA